MAELAQTGGRGPISAPEVLRLLEEGRLAAPEAFGLLQVARARPHPTGHGEPARRRTDGRAGGHAGTGGERSASGERQGEGDARRRVAAVLADLDALVGLDRVKQVVHELHAFVEVQRRRRSAGLLADAVVLHMVFRGNPGTGKTTVARLLGRLFKEMGVLQKGQVVEVERADLVGEYIGHTAQKTREQIKRALGGVLFVDEAYSLARGGEKDFGKEATDCLVKAMEDQRENLIVVLAGYREEMAWFLRSNPGLRSRFPIHIDFPDYRPDELRRIAERMVERRQYVFSDDALQALGALLASPERRGAIETGNARYVRNVVERALRRQAVRLLQSDDAGRDELMRLTAVDVLGPTQGPAAEPVGAAGPTVGELRLRAGSR